MLALLASFALVAAGSPTVYSIGPDRVEPDARALCAVDYPDDLAMMAACVRNARSGAQSFFQIRGMIGQSSALHRSLQGCIESYFDGQHLDWAMLGACARNQLAGARELGL